MIKTDASLADIPQEISKISINIRYHNIPFLFMAIIYRYFAVRLGIGFDV
jgi:hypothetical protein